MHMARLATDADFFFAVFANSKKYSMEYTTFWRKLLVIVIIDYQHQHWSLHLPYNTKHGFSDEILWIPFPSAVHVHSLPGAMYAPI